MQSWGWEGYITNDMWSLKNEWPSYIIAIFIGLRNVQLKPKPLSHAHTSAGKIRDHN